MRIVVIITLVLFVYRRSFVILLLPVFVGGLSIYFSKYNEILSKSKSKNVKTSIKFNKFLGRPSECTLPTIDNPTMNFMMSDYRDNPNKPEACDTVNDPEVKELMDKYLNYGVYRDSDDVYNNQKRHERFYTMPTTSLNGEKYAQFRDWVYNSKKSCKEDTKMCTPYVDIRYNQKPIPTKQV